MSLYDLNGEPLAIEIDENAVKNAFIDLVATGQVNIGSPVGATLIVNDSLESAWRTNADTVYASMIEEYKTLGNTAVPFFISTDQHSGGLEQHRYVNNIDITSAEIISMNLGDTAYDHYGETTLDDMRSRTKQVKNYLSVVGNHDKNYNPNGTLIPNDFYINKGFITTMDMRHAPIPQDCYVAYDNFRSVKFVCIDNYILAADGHSWRLGFDAGMSEWLIEELSKNDGYDIVVCVHWPLFISEKSRSDSEEVTAGTSSENTNIAPRKRCWDFMVARKNKQSGTFSDLDGVDHSYDFTGCRNELLCILSGHQHNERYSVQYGLTNYCADWWGNAHSSVFGIIDRKNSLLKIWKFGRDDVSELLELPI